MNGKGTHWAPGRCCGAGAQCELPSSSSFFSSGHIPSASFTTTVPFSRKTQREAGSLRKKKGTLRRTTFLTGPPFPISVCPQKSTFWLPKLNDHNRSSRQNSSDYRTSAEAEITLESDVQRNAVGRRVEPRKEGLLSDILLTNCYVAYTSLFHTCVYDVLCVHVYMLCVLYVYLYVCE